ncbi:hypothetical protein SAMN05192561_102236 [Halopenitus malekzadehii]|uniref:IclR helix-turn-helix domain-containing protein n=1 Tax=Halopenitus malekzadehii TaxID=1267564 RepID=A0A1H6IE34_9EURY|nr:hypothetical protein [Halopenitus malekzadehii]SEH47096.1 hypothetical protein SAMN05192561_102236 [Halopenitus malekzadehii]
MRRSVAIGIGCCFVLLVAGLTGAIAPTAAEGGTPAAGGDVTAAAVVGGTDPTGTTAIGPTPHDPQIDSGGFERSVFEITVHRDGRGVWTLRYERVLESADERDSFETFAERFRTDETDLYRNFRADATGLVDAGQNATDREMAADGFSRDAFVRSTIGNDIGVVELRFTWHGFGVVGDGTVTVGDVFEGGFYVGPDQELVFKPGDSTAFQSVEPPGTRSNPDALTDSVSVTWEGERQFTDRRPWAVFAAENATDSGEGTASGGSDAPDSPTIGTERSRNDSGSGTGSEGGMTTGPAGGPEEMDDGGTGWVPIVAALGVVGLLLGVVIRRRLHDDPSGTPATTPSVTDRNVGGKGPATTRTADGLEDPDHIGGPDDTTADPDGDTADPNGDTADPNRRSHARETTAGGSPAPEAEADDHDVPTETDAEPAATTPSIPDEELLSDDDRVIRILREHGGRIKQSRIVDRTEWSKSKVSVLLSEMTDEGTVSKLRVGRENVVSLEGHEPDIAGSPFDDDGAETSTDESASEEGTDDGESNADGK